MGDLVSLFGKDGFQPPPELTPDPPEHQLIEAMSEHGIKCSEVVFDGKLHRFGKNRTSWYAAHGDNIPAGAFGDWKLGIQENWCADIGRNLTDEERALTMAQIEAAQQRRREEEAEKHARAASKAKDIWENATPAAESQYLKTKGIDPGPARALEDGRLVLPMWDNEGQLASVQLISPNGEKRFLTGGKVRGCLGFFGTMQGSRHVYLAEGFATAMTIHQTTGCPVFWSYSAQNMPPVAEHVAGLGVPLTIVADNDESGTGQKYANKAAKAVGCNVVVSPKGDANDYAQSGGDVKQLLGHTEGSWLIPFSELTKEPMPIRWLVKHWIPQGGLGMVFGPSGVGKTFFVLDMALSVAAGLHWGDSLTKLMPVAYLAGEGHHGISSRLKGWALARNVSDAKFWVSRGGVSLDTVDGYNHARTELAALPERPGLIIVDTLHRFLSGDENNSQDAGKMIRACDKLGQEFGATVLLVHHTGHGGDRARGSTAWKGALDVEIGIRRLDDGEVLVAENHKQKDSAPADPIYGTLAPVKLPWHDEDGEPVTTRVWTKGGEPQEDKLAPLAEEIRILERAWFATNAEDMNGAPYVGRSAFANFLETEMGMRSQQVKRAIESSNGLVSKLTQAGVIAHHAWGWIVVDDLLSSRLMLSRG